MLDSIARAVGYIVIISAVAYALLHLFTQTTVVYQAEAKEQVEAYRISEHDDNEYYKLVMKYAEEYDVSFEKMYKTIECESTFVEDVQSRHRFADGTRENSHGLAQIYVDVHDVTRAQAIDPEFAVEWMAQKFSKGKHHLWTCYRHLYQS